MISAFQNIDENITLVRGDTLAFAVELFDEDPATGEQTPLTQDLDYCYFSVSKNFSDTTNVFQKSLQDGISKIDAGKYRVRIAPEDTVNLEVGEYYYDLEIGINGDRFTLLRGLFDLEYDITQIGGIIPRNTRLIDFIEDNIGAVTAEEINGATEISDYAFYNKKSLTSIDIPAGVTKIGDSAFWYCTELIRITIPNTVTTISELAFNHCDKLTSFIIPNSVTSIGSNAFAGCEGLTSIKIPNSVTSIGSTVFSGCRGLTSVILPDTIESIGGSMFSYCTSLTSMSLPGTVTNIGSYAFNGCSALASLAVNSAIPPTIARMTFSGAKADMNIYVPAESVDAYKAAQYWSERADYIQAIPTV